MHTQYNISCALWGLQRSSAVLAPSQTACASDDSPSGRRARAEGKLHGILSLTSVPFVHKLFDRRLDRLQLEM